MKLTQGMFRYLFFILLGLLVFLGIVWFSNDGIFKKVKRDDSSIVLERIQKVNKLVTIEGHFSELYHHNEYYKYDFFDLFNKKLILRVNAKVLIGHDLDKADIKIDSLKGKVVINHLPQPEIIAIEHDIDYYDIKAGLFASFTPEEYNKIQKDAKNLILDKVGQTSLLKSALDQQDEYIAMLEMAVKSAGWQLEFTKPQSIEKLKN